MLPPAPLTSRGEQAKTQLVAAAMTLFGEKGLHGATTRDIAQLAEQNIAAIPYYFGSKDGLYLAVAHYIADYMLRALGPVFANIDGLLAPPVLEPERYRQSIHRIFIKLAELLSQSETLHLSQIISREQLSPTAAHAIIHQKAIAPMNRRIVKLVAGYTGCDPNATETLIHTHAMLGEVLSFRIARETVLLQTGWSSIGPEQITVIQQVLLQHIDWLLNGMRAANTR